MSIVIDREACIGCGRCVSICPGNLIQMVESTAFIVEPRDCWGCASCVKECPVQAIALYLARDIGGKGGRMTARRSGSKTIWTASLPDGRTTTVDVDSTVSNSY